MSHFKKTYTKRNAKTKKMFQQQNNKTLPLCKVYKNLGQLKRGHILISLLCSLGLKPLNGLAKRMAQII